MNGKVVEGLFIDMEKQNEMEDKEVVVVGSRRGGGGGINWYRGLGQI